MVNHWGGTSDTYIKSKHDYAHDELGRRTSVVRTGPALDPNSGGGGEHLDAWQYNPRSELTRSDRYTGLDPNAPTGAVDSLDRIYTYDPAGNRVQATEGVLPAGARYDYAANAINQYTRVAVAGSSAGVSQRAEFDADGNLIKLYCAADMNGDGDVNITDFGMFSPAPYACAPDPNYNPDADLNGDGCVNVVDQGIILSLFGQTNLGLRFTYDGENRLIRHEPLRENGLKPDDGDLKSEFKYDGLGRRIEKAVSTYDVNDPNDPNDDTWNLTDTRRFVWDGWLLLLELDGNNDILRKYTWGQDVSGEVEGAGGVGGLLSCLDTQGTATTSDDKTYVYAYDGGGNVTELFDVATGAIAGHYEYDAYGNLIAQWGAYADENPFRFSTKYFDAETKLYYYGHRYYSAKLGRWLNRDPLEEAGGVNLYEFVSNAPSGLLDPLGLEERDYSGPVTDEESWFWQRDLEQRVAGWTTTDLVDTADAVFYEMQVAIKESEDERAQDLARRLDVMMKRIKQVRTWQAEGPAPTEKRWLLEAQRCCPELNPDGVFNKGENLIEYRNREAEAGVC